MQLHDAPKSVIDPGLINMLRKSCVRDRCHRRQRIHVIIALMSCTFCVRLVPDALAIITGEYSTYIISRYLSLRPDSSQSGHPVKINPFHRQKVGNSIIRVASQGKFAFLSDVLI